MERSPNRSLVFLLVFGVAAGVFFTLPARRAQALPEGASAPAAKPATAQGGGAESDRQAVAALDIAYQRAVKENDVATMAQILQC